MKVGSLFSGIGGLDLGLQRAGMEIRWQIEVDPFCLRVLARHFPHAKRYGDIREVKGHELEAVDLVAGGFPCQPVSVAGKKKGEGDERWLWGEFARIVREIRPRYVLVENVIGLLRRGMATVLGDLSQMGYDAEWFVFPASAVGAPHRRERVFIFAYPSGERLEGRRLSPQPARVFEPVSRATVLSPSAVLRTRHGFPHYVDRIRALGNAVVPQVAEAIGRAILEWHAGSRQPIGVVMIAGGELR